MRVEITQRLRLVFFAMLLLASGQVLWWLYDQGETSRETVERTLALYAADASAATEMARLGAAHDRVFATFPHLALREGAIVVDPVAEGALRDEHRRRIRQYRWEGGFFLVVLLVGMGILRRTIEAEATLRRRQRDFVAAVTHELKSPLASLQLATESMARKELDPAGKARWLGRMSVDIGRLGAMIANILDVTRLDHGDVVLRPGRVPLATRVHALAGELRDRGAESGVSFTLEVPDDLAAHADPTGVEVVLRNVLLNALHATAAEGGTVTVSGRWDEGQAVLTVADDGIGFPPEEAERLFQRFYRVGDEMVRRTPGSGLGLAIARRYMDLSGGRISAASAGPGRGATFTLRWPAEAA